MFDFWRGYQVQHWKIDKAQYVVCLCNLLKYANFAFDLLNDEKRHDSSLNGFLLEKNLRVEDNRPLFFKTIGYCFYIVFRKFYGRNAFRGVKVVLRAAPPTPCSRKPAKCLVSLKMANLKMFYNLHCVRVRVRLRSQKLSIAQQSEPHFNTA